MTLEMQQMLEREMDDALELEDSSRRCDAVQTVILHYLRALTDCQRKTAERVKELVKVHDSVGALEESQKDVETRVTELVADRDRMRARVAAVNWIGRSVAGFAAAGGFVVLVKILKGAGVL